MTLQYWYMLPVAVLVGTMATGSSVDGATFLPPAFILALRLRPEVAIRAALITEVFGVASGPYIFSRKRLIDHELGISLPITTIPLALLGASVSGCVEPDILKAILGVGLFAVAANALQTGGQETVARMHAAILQKYGGRKGKPA